MRLLTVALILSSTNSASAQISHWYWRIWDARDTALTGQADAEVQSSEAVYQLGVLVGRVDRLRSGNILSAADVEHLDLTGEFESAWRVAESLRRADQAWRIAEAGWQRVGAYRMDPDGLIRKYAAAALLYMEAMILALDHLDSIEERQHWLNDHLDRLNDMNGWH